jgi:glucose/mannose-6-phosphate isomerase
MPLFIGSGIMTAVAYRAKCQVNENAKMEAFFSYLPEANHNEIEGFKQDRTKLLQPVILRSNFERAEMKERMNATTDILDDMGYDCVVLHAPEDGSSMEQMMALTHYLDTVSLDLAELNGVDPIEVPTISLLKEKLA